MYYDSTEDFTQGLNLWITVNITRLREFFDKIAVSEHGTKMKISTDRDQVWALSTILEAFKQNRERIFMLLIKPETKKVRANCFIF